MQHLTDLRIFKVYGLALDTILSISA